MFTSFMENSSCGRLEFTRILFSRRRIETHIETSENTAAALFMPETRLNTQPCIMLIWRDGVYLAIFGPSNECLEHTEHTNSHQRSRLRRCIVIHCNCHWIRAGPQHPLAVKKINYKMFDSHLSRLLQKVGRKKIFGRVWFQTAHACIRTVLLDLPAQMVCDHLIHKWHRNECRQVNALCVPRSVAASNSDLSGRGAFSFLSVAHIRSADYISTYETPINLKLL